jgi:hypothetical protein
MRYWIFSPRFCLILAFLGCTFGARSAQSQGESNGVGPLFDQQSDIGTVLHPGSASYDAADGSYTIMGSGENMWATEDDFHFLWKKVSGNVSITANIAFATKTGIPHKKAVLMIRQSLDPDSPYVDAALHVVGLTSLQSRAEKAGLTHEVGIDGESATRLRLVKRGPYFYMYVARPGEELHLAGGSMRLVLEEPFYIGLGVCAHDKDALETAVFSNVSIGPPVEAKAKLYSTIETMSASSTDQRVIAVVSGHAAAPSWTTDGSALLFELGKKMMTVPAAGGKIDSTPRTKSQKTQGERPSPDGQRAVELSYEGKKPNDVTLSLKTSSDGKTKVLAKIFGGAGTLGAAPWSPDGKKLAFVSYQLVPEK